MNLIESLFQPLLHSESTALFLGATLSLLLSSLASLLARKRLPIAHSVAIIGFPRSGKTTLVTSIFAEIFSRRITGVTLTPRGDETINKVNEDIARLESGKELGATTAQDLFAYRAEMSTGSSLFSRHYKIEIGDFPGEDSEKFIDYDVSWLQNLPYFKWAMEANAFMFVIDVAAIESESCDIEYKSKITAAYRAAWQKLKDHHYDGRNQLQNKPVVIVFTKADLLVVGSQTKMPVPIAIKEKELEEELQYLEDEYSDLISYLKSETKRCTVTLSSAFAKTQENGARLGIIKVLRGILPSIF